MTQADDVSCPAHILDHIQSMTGSRSPLGISVEEIKSAQQQVFILTLSIHKDCSTGTTPTNDLWREALETGRHRVVVRIWKGSARWWNLHQNEPFHCSEGGDCSRRGVFQLARAEVAGYRIAKEACSSSLVRIPNVLYFSLDECHDHPKILDVHGSNQQGAAPWAILSYVGPESSLFRRQLCVPCSDWGDGMVKMRHEFGFEEPHPRWGRVPVNRCLDYTIGILQQVILPMHFFFFSNKEELFNLDWSDLGLSEEVDCNKSVTSIQYLDMVRLYLKMHKKMAFVLPNMVSNDQGKLDQMVKKLGLCIGKLNQEAKEAGLDGTGIMPSPVLCHMDYQPQNVIFYRRDGVPTDAEESDDVLVRVSSVLDWEEAAFCDPRFEILLLCRKVCANMEQAQAVWNYYTKEVQTTVDCDFSVGPMVPWLKLETVHSISTLLLQSMNLLGGGRNPWETKPDLFGKIEREFQRLYALGWNFCVNDDQCIIIKDA